MMKSFLPLTLWSIFAWTASGQDETLCTKYTTLLLVNNTAENQLAVVQSLVDLAVLGGEDVPGILASEGGLLDFFNGAGPTTNRDGEAVSLNFLDGASGLPDNLDPSSSTAILLNHLYQFVGALIGCTESGFPEYEGVADMYEVHKFMNITKEQNDYFIQQIGGAASSLGVTDEDVAAVASVLDGVFNKRCTPEVTADSGLPSFMVGTNPSICHAPDCPVEDESLCPEEDGTMMPATAPSPVSMPAPTAPGPTNGSGGSPTSSGSCATISVVMITTTVLLALSA